MPRIFCALAGLIFALSALPSAVAGEVFSEVIIEKLNRGEFSPVEQTLRRQVIEEPLNDNARFALALVQVVRAFERSAQFHYEYGARFGNAPFLLPSTFSDNPEPNRISYLTWRRELQTMQRDLEAVERLLAEIRDPQVKVKVPLGKLQWDVNGDGKPENWMPDNAIALTPHFRTIAKENPNFTVAFDYADVQWFRGYCHLTMAALDFILSLDLELPFDAFGGLLYRNPRVTEPRVADPNKADFLSPRIAEPDRWRQVRHHLVRVTELSLATWEAAERETDDDFEWLPNPKQTAAIRIQTTPEMIAAWKAAMREGQAVLEGRKLFRPPGFSADHGLNVKRYLDAPPERFHILSEGLQIIWPAGAEKYIEKGVVHDEAVFNRLDEVFRGQTIEFSFWFN